MDELEGFQRGFLRKIPVVLVFFLTGIFFIVIAFVDNNFTKTLVVEDGIVEYSQALLFLIGGCLWGYISFKTLILHKDRRRFAIFYLLFMGMFLFFFLEEISYGQRIFGFSTPEPLKNINMQDETTVHNIGISDSLLWIHLLMGTFMITIGLGLPVLKLSSEKAAIFFEKHRFPIVHQDLISCFLISLVFYSHSGFHPFIPIAVILLSLPIILILSGRLKTFFRNFKYPLIQFILVAAIGFLVIAINIHGDLYPYLSDNIAFEIRELLIALSLFFFAAFLANDIRKRKNISGDIIGNNVEEGEP